MEARCVTPILVDRSPARRPRSKYPNKRHRTEGAGSYGIGRWLVHHTLQHSPWTRDLALKNNDLRMHESCDAWGHSRKHETEAVSRNVARWTLQRWPTGDEGGTAEGRCRLRTVLARFDCVSCGTTSLQSKTTVLPSTVAVNKANSAAGRGYGRAFFW